MPCPKLLGEGSICSVLLKKLHRQDNITSNFPNAVATTQLNDLVTVKQETDCQSRNRLVYRWWDHQVPFPSPLHQYPMLSYGLPRALSMWRRAVVAIKSLAFRLILQLSLLMFAGMLKSPPPWMIWTRTSLMSEKQGWWSMMTLQTESYCSSPLHSSVSGDYRRSRIL